MSSANAAPKTNITLSNNFNSTPVTKVVPTTTKKIIRNIQEFTRVGFSGYGVKKVNQDNFFVFKNFVGNPSYYYMSVW
jgi:hypothetical protein